MRNVLHSHDPGTSDRSASTATTSSRPTPSFASVAAAVVKGGRSVRDAEIANHYNSGLKYGVAGSDGTLWSNYYYHTINNHELLSLFLADRRNPYNRPRRVMVTFSKISLSLLLAAAFSTMHPNRYDAPGVSTPLNITFGDSLFISLILSPYGYILDNLASCTPCTRANFHAWLFTKLSYCTLFWIAFVSIFILVAGIVVAVVELKTNEFIKVFFISQLLDYASYFYFGIWNWYLLSWEGCLLIPVFPLWGSKGCPPRFMPVFAFWPIKAFLQLYGLCQSTYAEDRMAFQQMFSGRVAVDRLGSNSAAEEGEGRAEGRTETEAISPVRAAAGDQSHRYAAAQV